MPTSLLARIFAEAGNDPKATSEGFACGHEPVHQSKSGACVKINSDKGVWYCTACNAGGDAVQAVMSLRGVSRDEAAAVVREMTGGAGDASRGRNSQATVLVELAKEATLWHTPGSDGDAWATVRVHDHQEHAAIRTKAFRRWLVGQYYAVHKSAPGAQGVQDALGILDARAVHDGPEHPVYVRVAECDGRVYLDLANERWEAIEITVDGWRVVADPPVHFKRTKGMLALPYPVSGGSIEELRPFVNVSDEDWVLVKAWLLGALSPQGPYPLLELHGEQGTAKSTTARLLRALTDPSTVPLRSVPKEEKDLIISSSAAWLQVLDNLSHIPVWLSDALSRLATGGGLADRELYTNGEIFLLDVQRPCIITGIEDLASRSDLLDRAIPLTLAPIGEEQRIAEKPLWMAFERARPRILGALVAARSCALRNLPSTTLDRLPRMADFALQVVAASEALGFTPAEFFSAYSGKRDELHAEAIESNLVAQLIIRLVADTPFTGTAQSLLVHLEILAEDKEKKSKFFPTSARGLSNAVRRIAPNLRAVGYVVEFKREGKNRVRLIYVEWVGKTSSASSASSATAENKDFSDAPADDSGRKSSAADANGSPSSSARVDPSTTSVHPADATPHGRTMADANGLRPSSAININETSHFTSHIEAADAADAKFPPCSTSRPAGSEERAHYEQEERQAIQEEDLFPGDSPAFFDGNEYVNGHATDGTEAIEVGVSHEAPLFEYVTTARQLEAALPTLLACETLALDTETTGLDPLKDSLRLVQLAAPSGETVVIDAFSVPVALLAPLFSPERPVLIHNAKFDLQFLSAAGLPWPGQVFDTLLAAQLLGAGTKEGLLKECGLAAVASRYLGLSLDKTEQTSQWGGELSHQQLLYAAKDAQVLLPLAEALRQEIHAAGLDRVATIENRCVLALAWLEQAGLPLDGDRWRTRAKEEAHKAQALEAQLHAMVGRACENGGTFQLHASAAINWQSPTQVLAVLTSRGHAVEKTDSETLAGLADPLAALLLEYREAVKRAGTYGEVWLKDNLHPITGRVHADYFQLGAASGRMSCTRPNMQNLPRGGDYRRCVRGEEGTGIVKADFSQIELRIAAALADESNMLDAFRAGEDLHRLTAAKVLGISLDLVGKDQRQLAKALNFGLLYGMGAKSLRVYAAANYKVALSEGEANAHRQRFFQAYPGLTRWHRGVGAQLETEQTLETRTLTNRRRRDVTKYTVALNSPVQGAGADGLKLALARLYEHRHEAPEARLVATVHDEIVAECPAEEATQTAAWLQRHMTAAMTEIVDEAVPVEVETTSGRDWAGNTE